MSDSLEDRVVKFVDGLNLNEIGNRWPGNWIETFARMETDRLRREVEILEPCVREHANPDNWSHLKEFNSGFDTARRSIHELEKVRGEK